MGWDWKIRVCSNGPWDLYPPEPIWVYYMRDPGSGLVKIGRTVSLRQRYAAHLLGRPGLALLAIELGYEETERHRHEQFKATRTNKPNGYASEWFRVSPALCRLVTNLRKVSGDPWAWADATCRCELPERMRSFAHEPYMKYRVEPRPITEGEPIDF